VDTENHFHRIFLGRLFEVTLPPEEQFTAEGTPLKPIGKEISEKLIYEPAQIKVQEIHRIKYGVDSGDYVKTAPPVPAIIPKGIATPELLAHIIASKYADGLSTLSARRDLCSSGD